MAKRFAHKQPDDLPKDIHQALKSWHSHHAETQLDTLLYTYRVQEHRNYENPHLLINQVIMDGLLRLEKTNPKAAQLLQVRFLDEQTAQTIAYRLNTSENAIYQRQRAALQDLSAVLWELETAARDEQANQIALRLPPPTYTKLFGVDDTVTESRQRITSPTGPWILALEGMGGIGKTTLADTLARDLAYEVQFKEIVWLSARRQIFRLPGKIERLDPTPALTIDNLLDQLVDQLGLSGLARQSGREKHIGVLTHLKRRPSLIIIDNLETIEDYRALVPQLREFTNPSKFLITTRYSLRGESGVYIVPLTGLSAAATLAFIHYEAEMQGLPTLSQAEEADLMPIYEITGGNPLAIKLILGQCHTFPLATVLNRIEDAGGQATQKLLTYIHADAWRQLDTKSRRMMQAMLLAPDAGGTIDQVMAASGLTLSDVTTALHRLVSHALIQTKDEMGQRYYTMHQLTQSFVARQSTGDLSVTDQALESRDAG